MARLEGKVAVVTGAASGIGAATARLFVSEGASVVLADIQDAHGQKIVDELGANATYLHTDVTNEADVAAAVQLAVDKYGRIDCMFNNAGIPGHTALIEDTDYEAAKQTVDVLLMSVFLGMKHAVKVMKAQGSGSIISTASVAGIGVGYGGNVYSACKAAIIHLTRCVANEVGESNVRVNAIAPGGIPTAIFGKAMGMDQDAAEGVAKMMAAGMDKAQPIPRAGDAADIAEAALWLASDASSFVTAECIVVDGGLTTGRLMSERMAAMQAMGAGAPAAAPA
jgi:NAD(P)-dependent dehydrogenase (short-subunit alcohol dehydrogenase family)